jgi:hypothetical protein
MFDIQKISKEGEYSFQLDKDQAELDIKSV